MQYTLHVKAIRGKPAVLHGNKACKPVLLHIHMAQLICINGHVQLCIKHAHLPSQLLELFFQNVL